jgi:hypothetical protein
MSTKVKPHGWSVAAETLLDKQRRLWKERHGGAMPPEIEAKAIEAAHDQAIADVYGADWKAHVDANGKPTEGGIGSTRWLVSVSEEEAESHYAALTRYRGPAAATAERERIQRLKGKK